MQRLLKPLIALALLGFGSCGSSAKVTAMADVDFGQDVPSVEAEILRGAAELELIALDPTWPTPEQKADPARFHGYGVLGRAAMSDPAGRVELLDLIAQACRENDGIVAGCFDPRHGIRATVEGRTVDLVICFSCLQVLVFADGERIGSGDLASTQEPSVSSIFVAAGLTIAP